MPRSEFPPKVKVAAFERAKGRCEACGARLGGVVEYDCDHDLADALGGSADLENCVVLCKGCHKDKTSNWDRPHIDKANSQRKSFIGANQRKGRPLPGTKASGWKHHMDGTWSRR